MFSRPLAFLLLALGCVTAAAGGAYVATRHNGSEPASATAAAVPAAATTAAPAQPASQPVAETEAAVSSAKPDAGRAESPAKGTDAVAPAAAQPRRAESPSQKKAVPAARTARSETPAARTVPANGGTPAPPADAQPVAAPPAPLPPLDAIKPVEPQPEPRHAPQFEEVILPVASVIGLQLDTPLSSERARVEDRVDAHVTRDVIAGGRVAIPVGSRVLGSVVAVEKGGKIKQPARLAIRFHTLILADGSEVALHTEPIDRSSESPANSSAKKIGGAAVAGSILGAIIGGGKGAAIGGATGAAGGTAAVMAGDRSVVSMAPGSLLNAKLASPATITVERRDQ